MENRRVISLRFECLNCACEVVKPLNIFVDKAKLPEKCDKCENTKLFNFLGFD